MKLYIPAKCPRCKIVFPSYSLRGLGDAPSHVTIVTKGGRESCPFCTFPVPLPDGSIKAKEDGSVVFDGETLTVRQYADLSSYIASVIEKRLDGVVVPDDEIEQTVDALTGQAGFCKRWVGRKLTFGVMATVALIDYLQRADFLVGFWNEHVGTEIHETLDEVDVIRMKETEELVRRVLNECDRAKKDPTKQDIFVPNRPNDLKDSVDKTE